MARAKLTLVQPNALDAGECTVVRIVLRSAFAQSRLVYVVVPPLALRGWPLHPTTHKALLLPLHLLFLFVCVLALVLVHVHCLRLSLILCVCIACARLR